MIEILMAVCMYDQPERCKDVRLQLNPEVTQAQCERNGQLAMPEWFGDNPNWRMVNWRCQVAGSVAKI